MYQALKAASFLVQLLKIWKKNLLFRWIKKAKNKNPIKESQLS